MYIIYTELSEIVYCRLREPTMADRGGMDALSRNLGPIVFWISVK